MFSKLPVSTPASMAKSTLLLSAITFATSSVLWSQETSMGALFPGGPQADVSRVEAIGTTAGELSADKSGSINYSIPIAAAPGTSGMEPKMSLVYSSQAGPGIAGFGWSLSGASTISRGPQTKVIDGQIRKVEFSYDDRFYLDGQRLILVSGTYGGHGAEYRTEIDSFTRVVSFGISGNGPEWFRAWTKAGLMIEFGRTADSHFNPQSRAEALTWSVNKISDTAGNYMAFQYAEDPTSGSQLLTRIDYTGNASANVTPYASLRFEYEQRPDATYGFIHSARVTSNQRLKTIRACYGEAIVRTYALSYTQRAYTERTILTSITETGADGKSYAPLTFEYRTGELGWTSNSDLAPPHHLSADGLTQVGVGFSDVNADGYPDLVYNRWMNGGAATQQGAVRNTGTSWVSDIPEFTPPNFLSADGYVGMGSRFVDLNGDGRQDFLVGRWINPSYIVYQAFLNTPSGWENAPQFAPPYPLVADGVGDMGVHLIDLNGDGLPDFVFHRWINGGNIQKGAYLNTGNGWENHPEFEPPQHLVADGHGDLGVRFVDFNGDGLPDILWHRHMQGGVLQLGARVNTGTGWASQDSPGYIPPYNIAADGFNSSMGVEFVDVNGDGLVDMVWHRYIDEWDTRSGARLNTGTGWASQDSPEFIPPIHLGADGFRSMGVAFVDVNADGLVDILQNRFIDDNNSQLGAYLNTGRGWVACGEFQPPHHLSVDWLNQHVGTDIVDIDANGAPDIVLNRYINPWYSQKGAHLNKTVFPDRLSKVTNGFGISASITYAPLTARDPITGVSTVYDKGSGATYPKADVVGPMYVVQSVSHDDGLGGQYVMNYRYGGLRSHAIRGSLGFETMEVTDSRTGIKSKTWLKQDYPFIGMPIASETRTNTNQLLSQSTTTYSEKLLNGGATRFPYTSESIQRSYELNGALVSEGVTIAQYDDWGNATRLEVDSLDGHEKVTVSAYDNWIQAPNETSLNGWLLGRLSRSTVTASSPTAAAQTRVSSFTYNTTTGLLVTETVEPDRASDPANYTLTTTYGYDAFGNKTSATTNGGGLGAGRSATTTYDAAGRFPVSTTNALGHSESYTYDQAKGVALTTTGPNGLTTSWIYDGFAKKIQENRADGTSSYIRYRWPGAHAPTGTKYLVETESTGSAPSLVCYDAMGRAFMSYSVNGGGVDGNARIVVQKTEFDNMGRAYRSSLPYYLNESPAGWTESANYDVLGRATLLITPNDDVSGGIAYSSIAYSGLVTTMTNAKGQVERVEKNAQGQVTRRVNNANAPPGSVERGEVTYTYDAFGQLLTTTVYKENGSTVSTSLSYDLRGRKTSMVDPDMGTWSYAYNAAGELATQTDAKGQITSMQYDPLGRLVQREERVWTGANPVVTTWAYDTASGAAVGKLHTVTITGDNANASVGNNETYSYDSLGRVNQSTRLINGQSFTLHQSFDPVGRPLVSTYPSGFQVKNVYTSLGFLKEVRRADSGLNDLYWAADSYALDGRINGEYYGNGMSVDQVYSQITGRLRLSQSGVSYAVTRAQDLSYTYDVLGNVMTRNDNAMSRSESFAYDGLNRLTQHTVGGGAVVSLTYDSLGNITHKSDVGNYAYDGSRRHAVVDTSGGSAQLASTYSYDGNGNMTAGAGKTYTWTLANQVKRAEKGGIWSEFQFGASNQRVLQTNNLGQSIYYVSGSFEEVRHPSGLIERKFYIYAPTGRVAVRVERNNGAHETRWFHHDGLGSINAVSDEGANIVQRFAYDAWGKRTNPSNGSTITSTTNSGVTRGYTDHEHLDDLGLVHMNGRVYDPTLSRFLSADPFIDDVSDSQSYNRYSYVSNNPLNHTDPSGFFKLKDALKIVAIIVVAYFTAGAAVGAFGTTTIATSTAVSATGSVAVGTSAISSTLLSAGFSAAVTNGIIGGVAGGFASGFAGSLLNGGNIGDAFKAGVLGGVAGAITGGVGAHYHNKWGLEKVIAKSAAKGISNEIQGLDWESGAQESAVTESLAWVNYEARRAQIASSSKVDPQYAAKTGDHTKHNATGKSSSWWNDGFKLGGGRFRKWLSLSQQSTVDPSPLGGFQGGQGKIGKWSYKPGSFADNVVESFAGIHDALNSWYWYDDYGNSIQRGGIAKLFGETLNYANVPFASPFAVAGAYSHFSYISPAAGMIRGRR
jgi:RHS repeat-associated protein